MMHRILSIGVLTFFAGTVVRAVVPRHEGYLRGSRNSFFGGHPAFTNSDLPRLDMLGFGEEQGALSAVARGSFAATACSRLVEGVAIYSSQATFRVTCRSAVSRIPLG